MSTIIFINGPPGAGKDTVADYFYTMRGYSRLKFADPIRQAVTRHFGIPDQGIEDWKQQDIGNGKTGRDFMIAYSECFIKPIHGADWFGKNAAQRVRNEQRLNPGPNRNSGQPGNVVISDAGFATEVNAFMATLGPDYNYLLIHLHRTGCTFAGDSRGWIETNLTPIRVVNDGTIEELSRDLDYIFRDETRY